MIMDSIPFCLGFPEKSFRLPRNIDRVFFAKNAPLEHEFEDLYIVLFKKPEPYAKMTG